jgi:hypothetical protein
MSKFVFTRHLFSCNNSHKKDGNWSRYKEPMISILGIITGLSLDKGVETSDVFVSCLIRTWITAIILYLPSAPDGPFNLYVSPFIKEKHSDFGLGLDKGNTPLYSIRQQLHVLEYFYSKLDELLKDERWRVLTDNKEKITNKIKIIIKKRKTVNIHYFSDDNTNIKDEGHGSQLYYSNINTEKCKLRDIIFDVPSGFSYKSVGGGMNNGMNRMGLINYHDTTPPLPYTFRYNNYHENGLFLFMEFIKLKKKLDVYYVVTHSKLMENFLKLLIEEKKLQTDTKVNFEDIFHNIEHTNACDLSFRLSDSTIKHAKIYTLYYTPGITSFEMYENHKAQSWFPEYDKSPCEYTNSNFKEKYKGMTVFTLTKMKNQVTRKFNNFTDWFKTKKSSGGRRPKRKRSFRR